ncbi:MAG: hypothetical protein IPO21_03970 [Bacteroidales bacterium]|nr:hypothetical protein [Bacteroidales bacterium]
MATITINEKTKKGKILLNFLKMTYGKESFISFDVPNAETISAFDEVKAGNVVRCNDSKDLLQKLRS